MAKRRRSESLSDFEDNASDVSFTELPKKKRKPAKAPTKKAARKRETQAEMPMESGEFGSATPHKKSLHVLESGEEICDALLGWYAGVHTLRAMPWRKPYNPDLNKEERAQRAYEVCVCDITRPWPGFTSSFLFARFGCPK